MTMNYHFFKFGTFRFVRIRYQPATVWLCHHTTSDTDNGVFDRFKVDIEITNSKAAKTNPLQPLEQKLAAAFNRPIVDSTELAS